MHETTQRRVCRVVFLTVCVLPTLALAAWVTWRLSPSREAALLASLGQRLGVRITVQSLTTPKPGCWRATGMQWATPETGGKLLTLDHAEFQIRGDQLIGRGGEMRLTPSLATSRLHQRLCEAALPAGVVLKLDRLTLVENDGAQAAWRSLDLRLTQRAGDGPVFSVQQTSGGASLVVSRDRSERTARTRVLLRTAEQTIPAQLVGVTAPGCRFRGQVEATLSDRLKLATLRGTLSGVDPAAFLGRDATLTANRPARAEIAELRMVEGRIERLDARIVAGSGAIGRQLLTAAAERLGFRPGDALQRYWYVRGASGGFEPIPFDRLAVRVMLDASGVGFRSLEETDPSVLAQAGEPLLLAPAGGPAPIDALTHLADPQAVRLRPASPAADALANRLPEPRIR